MFNAEDWEYLGEGNANIIVKYSASDAGSPMIGKCLRLTKLESFVSVEQRQQFQQNVVETLFGREYFPESKIVEVTRNFLESISHRIASSRLPKRLSKSINLDVKVAIMMDDLSSGNDVSLEIKPKWGFSPYKSSCRFCLHQKLRKSLDEQYEISRYCPLDLFSLNSSRMRKAIVSLFETPKNNLKIHCNTLNLGRKQFSEILESVFAQSDILQKLKSLQIKYHQDIRSLELEKSFEEYDKVFVSNVMNTISNPSDSRVEEKLAKMMLSVSLKDLSLFITLKTTPSPSTSVNCVELDRQKLEFKIRIIDLDFKSCEKLGKLKSLESQLDNLS